LHCSNKATPASARSVLVGQAIFHCQNGVSLDLQSLTSKFQRTQRAFFRKDFGKILCSVTLITEV